MGDGFEVDLHALRQAADGITRVTDAVASRPLDALDAGSVLGHEHLATAVADFVERWQRGVADLGADGREAAATLTGAADAYERSDERGARTIDGVLRVPEGPDPGLPR